MGAIQEFATSRSDNFSAEALRERVRERVGGGSEQAALGDHILNPALVGTAVLNSPRRASVLVPVIPRLGGASVLLTRRADHLAEHAGQIAFPGGKLGPEDATVLEAALREASEEVGLAPEFIEVIGQLGEYFTATGFSITPFIGIVHPGFGITPDTKEVAEVIEAPLQFLMTPANHRIHEVIWRGQPRRFYAMPYKNHYIWGATAGILRHMYVRLYSK